MNAGGAGPKEGARVDVDFADYVLELSPEGLDDADTLQVGGALSCVASLVPATITPPVRTKEEIGAGLAALRGFSRPSGG